MPDVRPRISPTLATLLRTGAAMHGLPSIGTYLEAVVLPMVRADIARMVALDPSLSGSRVSVPTTSVVVPVPTRTTPNTGNGSRVFGNMNPNTGNESRVLEDMNPKSGIPVPDTRAACAQPAPDSTVRAVVAAGAVVALDSERTDD